MRDPSATSTRQLLAPDVEAPVIARRALERFSGQLDDDVFERSALVLSEVVTNSVKHAGLTATQPVDLEIGLATERLRIEITDEGPGFDPDRVQPDPNETAGSWGLVLVDQLSDRWGVDFSHSTHVWCEFDLDPH
jgi:anti-sigma regulatory factor (Ser/Thr protein kinase)